MILAAGQGKRMRPLTNRLPKPLLKVAGKALIQHHVENLVRAGISRIIINHARFGTMIEQVLGDGSLFAAEIHYSPEGNSPLGVAGGIIQALPLLGDEAFVVVNGDVFTDLDFTTLASHPLQAAAHLVMVDNPAGHLQGDFSLSSGMLGLEADRRLTYSGIGIYQADFFATYTPGPRSLLPLLQGAVLGGRVRGHYFDGLWMDVGTPERLQQANGIASMK